MPTRSYLITLPRVLILILAYAAATVWITELWALRVLEMCAFLCAAAVACWIAFGKRFAAGAQSLWPIAGMCVWGLTQLAVHWTPVRSDTRGAILYWLSAGCLVWLGAAACTSPPLLQRLLRGILAAGSVFCVLGLLQLFTSHDRVFWLFPSGSESHVVGPFLSPNNYASFVQLLLPIALLLGCQGGRNSKGYLVLAAVLAASVFASGSRAGSALVIAEAATVFLLGPKSRIWRRTLMRFALLLSAFTLVVGYQYVWNRIRQNQDPYSFRREFLASSIAMVRAEPLHGFGLGTWTAVYPKFAIIDTGLFANHAHNEWAQWAAEGGLPALALMLALFVWAVKPAVQSLWGIGILSVMIHSWVDYPFLRLGLSAWIFILLGALAAFQRLRRNPVERSARPATLWPRVLAASAVPVLAIGFLQASKLAWADMLYRRATVDSLRRATDLCPDCAEYEFALSQIDTPRVVPHLERAIAVNSYFTNARIALAQEAEIAGEALRSEQILLEAANHDRQFAPAWALADFYFRTNQPDKFWPWARRAADMSYGDLSPLFDLCFLISPDSTVIAERVIGLRSVQRQFLSYLTTHGRLRDAQSVALQIVRAASPVDRDLLLSYIDAALDAGQTMPARAVWDQLGRWQWVPNQDDSVISNGDFTRPIMSRGFDWRLATVDGVVAVETHAEGPSLSLSFSGNQPEQCDLMAQFLPLVKGAAYVMRFQYRTTDLPAHTGLRWSLGSGREYPIERSEKWASSEWHVVASAAAQRLLLTYHRYPGTTRIEGVLHLRKVRMAPESVPFSGRAPMERSSSTHL